MMRSEQFQLNAPRSGVHHHLSERIGGGRVTFQDVSPKFRPNALDSRIAMELLAMEGTPQAIQHFAAHCNELSAYGYWYFLSTLWVSYSGHSDLALWRRLFSARRPHRAASIMKPSELTSLQDLPDTLQVFRAHREKETDWISYTLAYGVAVRFAVERGVREIVEYRAQKSDVLALFLRRQEQEVIILDPASVQRMRTMPLTESSVFAPTNEGEKAELSLGREAAA